ncbi:MAG: hypothetical protein ABIA97_03565 [Candidatus Omnitrophota bacterium]
MKVKNIIVILFIFIFVCLGYAYAKDKVKNQDTTKTETKKKKEKPERKVRDRQDAIEIAKEYLADEDMQADYHLIGHMTKPLVKLKGDVWHVVFLKKKKDKRTLDTRSIRIIIDKDKGQIAEAEEQEGFFLDGKVFR